MCSDKSESYRVLATEVPVERLSEKQYAMYETPTEKLFPPGGFDQPGMSKGHYAYILTWTQF